jgi:hypothetical protein
MKPHVPLAAGAESHIIVNPSMVPLSAQLADDVGDYISSSRQSPEMRSGATSTFKRIKSMLF